MTGNEGMYDRRKHTRYHIQGDAFVLVDSYVTKVGRVIDISKAGLSFEHVGRGESLDGFTDLGLFSADRTFSLYKIPCKVISCFELYRSRSAPVSKGRYGVEFGQMTTYQRACLEYFVEHHSKGESS